MGCQSVNRVNTILMKVLGSKYPNASRIGFKENTSLISVIRSLMSGFKVSSTKTIKSNELISIVSLRRRYKAVLSLTASSIAFT